MYDYRSDSLDEGKVVLDEFKSRFGRIQSSNNGSFGNKGRMVSSLKEM